MHIMEIPYSNRELDMKFVDIHEKLDLILVQTTKHNGRMSKIERYSSYVQGGMAVLSIVVLPILGWVLYQVVSFGNIDDRISLGVSRALSEYEINLK